jgi:DNA modification methylase
MEAYRLIQGEALEELRKLDANSVEAMVSDPPAGISFMGKEWDAKDNFILRMSEIYKECLRVLKPGAHGFVWAIPRTSHWTATALEDAGFEIRDVVTHIFGSGFPKSLDISKAIDKAAGKEPIETSIPKPYKTRWADPSKPSGGYGILSATSQDETHYFQEYLKEPSTLEAKQWQGWGTALKPASEHWILIRKPISEKTVAANVLKHGCGGINIDESRINYTSEADKASAIPQGRITTKSTSQGMACTASQAEGASNTVELNRKEWANKMQGRFPANLVLSHNEDCEPIWTFKDGETTSSIDSYQCTPGCAVAMLDEQSGTLKSGNLLPGHKRGDSTLIPYGGGGTIEKVYGGDQGGASRFFYCAKASKRERNEGCDGLPEKLVEIGDERPSGNSWERRDKRQTTPRANHHPTVKPLRLMSYLITMISPPNGTVLDPFMGSGSTGVAALRLGFKFIGIEREAEYHEIATARIKALDKKA